MSACLDYILSKPSLASPCFVIDLDKLRENNRILARVAEASGAKILLALKAFACWPAFPVLSAKWGGCLAGTCASSVDEARLGREEFGGETHAFAAAWNEAEISELTGIVDHLVFNSLAQWRKYRPKLEEAQKSQPDSPIKCGLRVNPEHSEGAVAIYNPCSPGSRLGIRAGELAKATPEDWQGITGLHFHTLCEQNSDALARTLEAFESRFGQYLPQMKWLNWGGGHHITREDYDRELLINLIRKWRERYGCDIYLEPGEAVALNAGFLLATVLDVVKADMPVAILDVSAACHMPDVLEMPYKPEVWTRLDDDIMKGAEPGQKSWTCRLAGKSCLAGDVIGEYSFAIPLQVGERLAFGDMAIYSMVKTTTFNGLRLPSIGIYDSTCTPPLRIIRDFSYEDFKARLA